MELSVGIKVATRGLEWDVTEIEPLGPQQRVRLACCGGDLAGLEWDVLYPAEALSVLQTDPQPEEAGSLSDWQRFHIARLLDQIPGAPAPPGRIAIEAYQRVPLLRALDMVRPRLLLADGVGLGKTIQAGLIAAELLVRRRAHRILIVSPPGPLLRQWEQEMRIRFGLRFTPITDSASLRAQRHGLELGGNPFDTTALCLTSMDFCKSDWVLTELERVAWDLVIIDEAHHCVGDENQRRRLAEVLADKSDGLLLLTATPHDGHDPHFASLMALLDPSLVDGAGKLVGTAYRRHVVRRLKSHIRTPSGAPLFRERIVTPVRVDVTGSAPVEAFHKALSALVAPRLQHSRDRTGLTDALAFVSLLKRSMSTIAACLATLRVVAERYGTKPLKERQRALRAYRRRIASFGVLDTAEEDEIAELEAEEMAASLDGEKTADELHALIRLGEAAAAYDPKLTTLVLEIRLIRLGYPNANVIVYTEYADSQRAAVAALADITGTILTISGADSESERNRAAERCAQEDRIVLVSTDSLAEGLNLHQRCFHLIHLDLPYNPNRLEQRNGRIDRYGQRNDPEIRYLFLAGTFEERLLLRLIAKYETARACLSFMPNTLGVSADPLSLHEPLFAGFAEDLFSGMPRLIHSLDLAAEDVGSDAYRDVLREIDRAFLSFDHMAVRHGWLAGNETLDQPPAEAPAGIDLFSFVASVLKPDADRYRVPPNWMQDLERLPGFDPLSGTVRLTNDIDRLRDASGRELLYPGRSHPLTRRAIASVRTGRVSAARASTMSLLVTYTAEVGSMLRTVFALSLHPDRPAKEHLLEPSDYDPTMQRLSLPATRSLEQHQPDWNSPADNVACQDTGIERAYSSSRLASTLMVNESDFGSEQTVGLSDPDINQKDLWNRLFAAWAPNAMTTARSAAVAIGERIASAFVVEHRLRIDRDAGTARAWADRCSNELCGPIMPWIGDLFDAGSPPDDWRSAFVAEQRLAGFAADPSVAAPKRREAANVLERLRFIMRDRSPLPAPTVRILGMLMLVP